MEGTRSNIACDYAYNPQQNNQNYRQDGGVRYYKKGYDSFQSQPHQMEQSIRSPVRSRQPSLSPSRHVSPTKIKEAAYENPNINDPVNQYYPHQNNTYDRNNAMNSAYEGDYNYNEADTSYYQIGDHGRNNAPAYDGINPPYEELNQVVQDGNYFSIIEDQYSTDEGEGFEPPYTPEQTDVMYGEPFDPASYTNQEAYGYDSEDQYEPSYYSASNIPTPPPLPGTGGAYRQRYQNYSPRVSKNPTTSSCPVLPEKLQNLRRKDLFQQVSKKIKETVVELRNAGIGDKAQQMKSSNPNLDYIKQYNSVGKPHQQRIVQRPVPERPNYPPQNSGVQRKMSQHQQQQLQFYKQLIQQKQEQISNSPEPGMRGLSRQAPQEVQARYRSPSRINQRVSQQDIINAQNIGENESFGNHPQYQDDLPGREGKKSMAQHINELSRKKPDAKKADSFVQLHAATEQAVPDCCRQSYNDFKKTETQEDTSHE